MAGIYKEIESHTIAAQIDLLRVDAALRRDLARLLKTTEKEIIREIRDIDVTGVSRTAYQQARFEKLQAAVRVLVANMYSGARDTLNSELVQVAGYMSEKVSDSVNLTMSVDLLTPLASAAQLKEIAKDTLIEGAPSKDWWEIQRTDLENRFAREVRIGMTRGESMSDIVDRIRGKIGTGQSGIPGIMDYALRNVEALVRTSVQTVANSARLATLQENDDVVRGIQWVSTLDSRTTPICRTLDGLKWDLEKRPIGHGRTFPGPTAHWGCRSTQVPLLRPWSELTSDRKLAKKLEQFDKGTRASIGGQVDDTITYESWLKSQSDSTQLKILGPTRKALWEKGKVGFRDLVSQDGRPKTIKELRGL